MTWFRCRFRSYEVDPRPVTFPPPGPYWITGYGDGGRYAVLVAYLPNRDVIREFWPEAAAITYDECADITFTSRFPRPEWWQG